MLALLKVLPLAAGLGLAPLVEPAPVEYGAATRLRGAGASAAPLETVQLGPPPGSEPCLTKARGKVRRTVRRPHRGRGAPRQR